MWGRAGGVKSVTRWGEESSSSSHYVAAGPASISCLMEVGGGWKVGSMAGSQAGSTCASRVARKERQRTELASSHGSRGDGNRCMCNREGRSRVGRCHRPIDGECWARGEGEAERGGGSAVDAISRPSMPAVVSWRTSATDGRAACSDCRRAEGRERKDDVSYV